jgi:serine-type D-Ala-D-Ala carboxypeptidase/endopeptidase (penicillin-binding protein 4)
MLLGLAAGGWAQTPRSAPSSDARLAGLRAELDREIAAPGWRNDRWSVLVVSLDRGDTLYARDAAQALVPASNMKLFTTAAALYYLGPHFRYSTYVMTGGRIEQGVLRGDLILYGTGDPTIGDRLMEDRMSVWEAFADSLQALGVRRIDGAVVGDASYFAGKGTGAGWRESYMNAWYAAPASALTFNENVVTLRVRPAPQVGWRPEVDLIPGGDGIAIVNQATTIATGRSWIEVTRAAYDGPIVVRGQIARGHAGVWNAVPVADPPRYTAAVFAQALQRRGIEVLGGIRAVRTPEESPVTGRSVFAPAFDEGTPLRVLAVHKSPPMEQILDVINRRSHNLYAESVLRTVGRVALGEGSAEAGARAIGYMLQRETGGVPPDLQVADGSGLSVLNRSSAGTLIHLLRFMAASPMWEPYWASLPEAGSPEGLRRMQRTPAEGNLRAKTGTIENVSALSGYVRSVDGERLAFAIVSNDVASTWRAKRVEDAIGARLAGFTRPGLAAGVAPPAAEWRSGGAATAAAPAEPGPRSHVIRPGDTLDGIARQHGTTVATLQRLNPGLDARRLVPGRSVRLP